MREYEDLVARCVPEVEKAAEDFPFSAKFALRLVKDGITVAPEFLEGVWAGDLEVLQVLGLLFFGICRRWHNEGNVVCKFLEHDHAWKHELGPLLVRLWYFRIAAPASRFT